MLQLKTHILSWSTGSEDFPIIRTETSTSWERVMQAWNWNLSSLMDLFSFCATFMNWNFLAGFYIPELADTIVKKNMKADHSSIIHLKGIMVKAQAQAHSMLVNTILHLVLIPVHEVKRGPNTQIIDRLKHINIYSVKFWYYDKLFCRLGMG